MSKVESRIGIYCPGAGTGGPWRYVHSILAALDPAEFEVTLFCDLQGQYEPCPWMKVVPLGKPAAFLGGAPIVAPAPTLPPVQSIHRHPLPAPLRIWAGFIKQARKLAKLIRHYPIDLFHTQNTGCEESPVAARVAGVPHVLGTFHVDSTYDLHGQRSGPTHRLMEMVSNRCLDAAIAVSQATKRDWLRRTHIPGNRVLTIHNGIDAEKFRRRLNRQEARQRLALPVDGLIVGGVGRLEQAKGFTYLLDAAGKLRGDFPNLFIAIAGSGPLLKELEAQALRLGLADRVRFLGFQPDVQVVLDALDVFVLPSLCETLGYALLEAMATELPAVGSAVGGVPEVIEDGVTGLLVQPRNAEQLGRALRRLLPDPDLRQKMGIAARQRVIRQFQEQEMVRRTVELYRKMLS